MSAEEGIIPPIEFNMDTALYKLSQRAPAGEFYFTEEAREDGGEMCSELLELLQGVDIRHMVSLTH